MNSLDVIEIIIGTKSLAIVYDGLSKAEITVLRGGHLSTMFFVFYKDHIKYQVFSIQL